MPTCPKCGYDLAGQRAPGACPECGFITYPYRNNHLDSNVSFLAVASAVTAMLGLMFTLTCIGPLIAAASMLGAAGLTLGLLSIPAVNNAKNSPTSVFCATAGIFISALLLAFSAFLLFLIFFPRI